MLTQCFELKNLMIHVRYIKKGEERYANMFISATILCRLSAFIMCYFIMKWTHQHNKKITYWMGKDIRKWYIPWNIQKTRIMASGPITSWQIDGKTKERLRDFISLGSNITADCDWNHEIKICLLLERKAMTNLDSILQSRDITLPTKFHLVNWKSVHLN